MSNISNYKIIKKYRQKANLTQQKLADEVGVSAAYIQQLENGVKNNPSLEVLSKISKTLNIDANLLFNTKEKEDIKLLQNIFEKMANDEPFPIYENKNFDQSIKILKTLKDKIENKELKDFFTNYLDKIPSSTILNKENIPNVDLIYNQEINPLINKLVDTLELEIYKLMNKK